MIAFCIKRRNSGLERREDITGSKWLTNETLAMWHLYWISREENDTNIRNYFPDFSCGFYAANSWHVNIDEDEVRSPLRYLRDCRFSGRDAFGFMFLF